MPRLSSGVLLLSFQADGGNQPAPTQKQSAQWAKGIESVSFIVAEMKKSGISEKITEKIMFENAEKFFVKIQNK